MKYNNIKSIGTSPMVNMGPIQLRQPIPTQAIEQVDPFVLLHHYGPYTIDLENNPFDLGPHPHRGFEPITFLIQGEQLHRDSLGNESIVRGGDVQWTTAGRGIIHAEGPTKEFVEKGGVLEGIQLWLNLPAHMKMIPANYQHVKKEDFTNIQSEDKNVNIGVVAGQLNQVKGKIETQTPVNAYMIEANGEGSVNVPIAPDHNGVLYLLKGTVRLHDGSVLKANQNQLAVFEQDGEGFGLTAQEDSLLLFLSGIPFKEEIASWGPYVMNTQTEIMEALRDYQQGKMGYLPVS
ncbi:MAG: pirin family protein [Gilvibacter sp.]